MKNSKNRKEKSMYWPPHYQISARHMLFNLLEYHRGKISRRELFDDILKTGYILSEKGYRIPVNIKGSPDAKVWSDDIDGEIYEWSGFGIIKEKDGFYSFMPKDEPFDSLKNLKRILNESLEPEVIQNLEDAIKKIPHRE